MGWTKLDSVGVWTATLENSVLVLAAVRGGSSGSLLGVWLPEEGPVGGVTTTLTVGEDST